MKVKIPRAPRNKNGRKQNGADSDHLKWVDIVNICKVKSMQIFEQWNTALEHLHLTNLIFEVIYFSVWFLFVISKIVILLTH